MTQTDPISDMLIRIKNAQLVKKPAVVLPYSAFKNRLAELLQKQGWLEKVEVREEDGRKNLVLGLKYLTGGLPLISGIKRVSRPGQRIYSKSARVPRVTFGPSGITVVSTSKGLMTDSQARKQKVGGEVICQIW